MKLGIIGGGVVGRATARVFMEHAEVRVYDQIKERATHGSHETLECDLVFVCLPTPQRGGLLACYTDILDTFLGSHRCCNTNFIIRSTVPIGYTRKVRELYGLPNLVHSPEFLTARCSFTDAQVPSRMIIGNPGPPANSTWSGDNRAASMLNILYHQRFPGVPVHLMTSDESEAVKLILNGFFAVKVAYFNEANSMALKMGLDWGRVMEGVLSDGRIAHSHTQVPGPDGKYGFGGTCLPKDLANLMECIERAGATRNVTSAALTRNRLDRERTK